MDVWAVWVELAELVPGLQLPQMSLATSKDKKIYAQRRNNANESFKAYAKTLSATSTEEYSKALVEIINKSASLGTASLALLLTWPLFLTHSLSYFRPLFLSLPLPLNMCISLLHTHAHTLSLVPFSLSRTHTLSLSCLLPL